MSWRKLAMTSRYPATPNVPARMPTTRASFALAIAKRLRFNAPPRLLAPSASVRTSSSTEGSYCAKPPNRSAQSLKTNIACVIDGPAPPIHTYAHSSLATPVGSAKRDAPTRARPSSTTPASTPASRLGTTSTSTPSATITSTPPLPLSFATDRLAASNAQKYSWSATATTLAVVPPLDRPQSRRVRANRPHASLDVHPSPVEDQSRRRSTRRRTTRPTKVHDGVGVSMRRRHLIHAARTERRVREHEHLALDRGLASGIVAVERATQRRRQTRGVGEFVVGKLERDSSSVASTNPSRGAFDVVREGKVVVARDGSRHEVARRVARRRVVRTRGNSRRATRARFATDACINE